MNLVTAATPTSKSVRALHLEPKTTLAIVNAAGQGGGSSAAATTVATTTITTTTTPNGGSSIGLIDAVKLAVAAVAVTNATCLPVALDPASGVKEQLEVAGGASAVSAAAASDTKGPGKKLGAYQGTTIDSTTTSQLDDDDNDGASKSNCPFVHLVLQQQRQQQQRILNASRSKTTTVAITAVATKDNSRATKIIEISPTKTPEPDQQQQRQLRRRPRRLSELEQCTTAAADNKKEDEHAASLRLPQEASDGDHRYARNKRGNDPQDDSVSMVAETSCANKGATTNDEPDGHNQTSGSESDHLDAETTSKAGTTKTGVVSKHEPAAMGGGHSLTKRPLVGPAARSGSPSKRSPPPPSLPTEAHEREATKSGVIISLQQLDGQRVKEPTSSAPTCGQPGNATTNRVSVLRSLPSRDDTEVTNASAAASAAEDSDMTVDSDCNQSNLSSRANSRPASSSGAAATTTTEAIVTPGSYPAATPNKACEARVYVPSGASSCSEDNATTNPGPAPDHLDHHAGEGYPMMQFLPIEQPPDGEMLRWGRRESSLMCEAFERSVSGRILAEGSATGEDSDREQNVEDRRTNQPNDTSRRARVQTLDSLTTPPPPDSFDNDRHQRQHHHDPHQNHHQQQQQHQQPNQHQQQPQQQQQHHHRHRQQSTKLPVQTIHHHAGYQTIHHHGGQQTGTPVAGQQALEYCARAADSHEQVVSYHHHHHHHHHGHQAPVVAPVVTPAPSNPTRPWTAYLAAGPTRQVAHEHYELAAADPSANQYFLVSETSGGGGGSAYQGSHHASKINAAHPLSSAPVAVAAPASSSLAPVALHHQHHYEQRSYSSVVHHQPYSTVGQISLADCSQQLQLDYTPIDNDLDVRFCQIQYTELTEHQLAVQTLDPHHRLRPTAPVSLASQHELVGYTDMATSTLEPQQQQPHKTYHLLGAPDEHSIQQETTASVVGLVQPAPTVQHHSLTATNYYQQTTSFTLYDPNHHNHHHHYHQHQYHELEGAYGNGSTSAAMLADYEQPIVSDHYDPSVALGSCLQQFEFDNENEQECDGSASESHDRDEPRGASSSLSLDNPNEYGAGSSASHSEAGSWSMAHHHTSQMGTNYQAELYEQAPSSSTSSGVSHQRPTTRRNQPAVSGGGPSTSAEKPKAGCSKETIEKLRAFLTSRMKLKASTSSTSASTSSDNSNTTTTTPKKAPGKEKASDSSKGANFEPKAGVKSQTGGYYQVDTNQPGPSQWSEPTSISSSRRASANSATYEQMAAGSSASNCGSNSNNNNNNKRDHSVYGSARSTSCSSLSSNSVEQDSTRNECLTPLATSTTTRSVSRTTSERRRPAKERLENGSVQMEVEREANIETATGGHTGRGKTHNNTNESPSKRIEEASQALADKSNDFSDHQMDCDEDKDSTNAGPDDDGATDSRKSSGVWSSASSSCATPRSNEESELELGVQTRASKRKRMQQQRQQQQNGQQEHPKPKRRSSDPPLRVPTITS